MRGVRSVTILGSTGSVGRSTIDLIERHPGRFRVAALTANENVALLAEQARRLRPRLAVIAKEAHLERLRAELAGTGIETAAGRSGLLDAATLDSDWVMAAIVGAAGLAPTLAAVQRGAVVGLANKECLVCAGGIVMEAVRAHGATLLPVDSEHNAIFQVFDFERPETVESIILTASGGPFRTRERHSLVDITPEEAVRHPNWSMGAKISVDSATMMNKGLELIEAFHLFPLEADRIRILVHPESVVHSLVEYRDGSVLAQLGSPDMRTPIAYALAWPERIDAPVKRLDLAAIGRLHFEEPDAERFPAIAMARAALVEGGSAPTILNAANEVAVAAFLARRIGFLDITRVVADMLAAIPARPLADLEEVIAIDRETRERADEMVRALT
ncbi:MAG: 1-deoxy-D-xylulose-5-phosphate reductoisomerase [Rhodothalassiaceae bacterium]